MNKKIFLLLLASLSFPSHARPAATTLLHQAAEYSDAALLQRTLRQKQIHVDTQDAQGNTPLHLACFHGNFICINILLTYRANVAALTREEKTPLHYAAHQGHSSCIEKLLRHGANINAQDYAQRTPLHEAARQGHILCVTKLLENGATIDLQDVDEQTPLHLAAMRGHTPVVIKLLGHKADVNAHGTSFAWTALHHAATSGQYACVRALIAGGATIDMKNACDETPLDLAEEKGYQHIAQYLKSKKYYLNKQTQQRCNNSGNTEGQS